MIHKCNYCDKTAKGTRDQLVDIGWSFADIRAPVRRYFKTCPEHFNEMEMDIMKVTPPARREGTTRPETIKELRHLRRVRDGMV